MNISDHIPYICCPVCSQTFKRTGSILSCDNAHTFDISKEGYVNLLLSHQKRSKNPGDTKDMLVARRKFLEKGFYGKLANEVNELVTLHVNALPVEEKIIFDVGCGEGYYIHTLQANNKTNTLFFGMDIAKEAIRMAAKKYTDILFLVGNIGKRFPMKNDSVHVLLNIFAPRNPSEFARIIHALGIVIIVIPAPNHLSNLRLQLGQDKIKEDKDNQVIENFKENFTLINKKELHYDIIFSQQDLLSLIKMTPLFWQTSKEEWIKMQSVKELDVNMRFNILIFKKN
jgi:23S rRNA (guanine745-N1)-methyltransferase